MEGSIFTVDKKIFVCAYAIIIVAFFVEFVNALGEPGTEDSIDDDEDDVSIF